MDITCHRDRHSSLSGDINANYSGCCRVDFTLVASLAGNRVAWGVEVLEELCEALTSAAPDAQFLWNNQQVVHVCPPRGGEPWATLHTKKLAALELSLMGPKHRFTLGSVADLGQEPELQTDRPDRDVVKLKFLAADEITPALTAFLREHYAAIGRKPVSVAGA